MIKAKELRQKNEPELEKMLTEKRHSLWNFRFGASGSKVRNVKEGVTLRKDIARILTVMNEAKK